MSEPLSDEELGRLVGGMLWRDTPEALAVTRIVEELRALRILRDRLRGMFDKIKPEDPDDILCDAIEDLEIRASMAERDLVELRAWRRKLGDPDTWFPGLFENDVPGETTNKTRKGVPSSLLAQLRFSKLQMEAIKGSADGIFEAADELRKQARALVERAKEGM